MAKFVTRRNPDTDVTVEIVNRATRQFENVLVTIRDLPAEGKNPARRANAIKTAVLNKYGKDTVIMGVVSVIPQRGYYRRPQDDFIAGAEFIDADDIDINDDDDM